MEKIKQCKMIVFSLVLAVVSIGIAKADITVTSVPLAHPVLSLSNALDGNPNTFVMILDGDGLVNGSKENIGSVIEVDFGEAMDISGIGWLPRQDMSTSQPKDFEVSVSDDGISWDVVLTVLDATPVPISFESYARPDGLFASARYTVNAVAQYLRFHVIETYGDWPVCACGYDPTSANLQLAELWLVTDGVDADCDGVVDANDCDDNDPRVTVPGSADTVALAADFIAQCEGEINRKGKNTHGQEVSCVAHLADALLEAGCINDDEHGEIVSTAARTK